MEFCELKRKEKLVFVRKYILDLECEFSTCRSFLILEDHFCIKIEALNEEDSNFSSL